MKKMEKMFLVLFVCLLISQPAFTVADKTTIKLDNRTETVSEVPILLDGQLIYTKPMSFIHPYKSYTLVPVRFITESLGARVGWEQESKKVTVVYGSKYISMNIDSRDVYINGEKKTLDEGVSPKLVEDNTMVPLRFLTETFGFKVDFDDRLRVPMIETRGSLEDKLESDKGQSSKVVKIGEEKYKDKNVIAIHRTAKTKVKTEELVNPKRMVVDLMDTTISKTYGEYKFPIDEVDRVRVSQFDASKLYGEGRKVVRLVVDLNEGYLDSRVDLVEEDGRILLVPSSKKKIEERPKNQKEEGLQAKADKISYRRLRDGSEFDFYLEKNSTYNLSYNKYANSLELLLPEDSFKLDKKINISDDLVRDLRVDKVGDFHRIIVNLKKEVEIKDKLLGNRINLRLVEKNPQEVNPSRPGQKLIVVDPGHGGKKPGSIQNGIVEKNLALDISKKLNQALKEEGYETLMTREDDSHVDLKARADMANGVNGDLLLSIHGNSAHPAASGVEVLYNPNDKAYARGEDSKELALILAEEISQATASRNRGAKDRPDLVVIRETNKPAVLVEVGFISNEEEAQLLGNEAYQDKIVGAIIKGLNKYFSKY